MSDRAQHCPFLNRADDRCSTNFSLEQLDRAFDYCFGSYLSCPMYAELLAERRFRRSHGSASGVDARHFDSERPGFSTWDADLHETTDAPGPFVQLTLSHKHFKPTAGSANVPAASGV